MRPGKSGAPSYPLLFRLEDWATGSRTTQLACGITIAFANGMNCFFVDKDIHMMARERGNSDLNKVAEVMELLGSKNMIDVLYALHNGPTRLSQLRRRVPDASKKALVARLRELQNAKIVVRTDLSGSVLHVEYELSPQMRQPITSLVTYLTEWSRLLPIEDIFLTSAAQRAAFSSTADNAFHRN